MQPRIRPFRALSLDGGGMRGVYTAAVLYHLAASFNEREPAAPLDIGKLFDLLVGTSTGGITACGLAAGVPLTAITQMYRDHGSEIFSHPAPAKGMGLFHWAFRSWNKAANSNVPLRNILTTLLGEETIGQLFNRRKIALCVPTVNMATHTAQVFKTPHLANRHADDSRKIVDVALAASAAPIIFPLASIPNPDGISAAQTFADGGLWANNPVLVTLLEALHMTDKSRPIEIVSIGTCSPPSGEVILPSDTNWGLARWAAGIGALNLAMDAQASGHQYIAEFLATRLTTNRRPIKIYRLAQTSPAGNQAANLAMDNPSQTAFALLTNLAFDDAQTANGQALTTGSALEGLDRIFMKLDPLERATVSEPAKAPDAIPRHVHEETEESSG